MKKIWIFVLVGFLLIVTAIGLGGKMYMEKSKKVEVNFDQKIEKKIAEEFSTKYLSPNNKDINEVTFYKEPVDQPDFTGNRNYFFYFNGNQKWKVGVSVEKESGEIWAFGSDDTQLTHKKEPKKVNDLKIKHWRDESEK